MTLLDDYLTLDKLADELSLNPRTLLRWSNKPNGLPYTKLGRRRLFNIYAVREWITEQEHRPNQRRVVK